MAMSLTTAHRHERTHRPPFFGNEVGPVEDDLAGRDQPSGQPSSRRPRSSRTPVAARDGQHWGWSFDGQRLGQHRQAATSKVSMALSYEGCQSTRERAPVRTGSVPSVSIPSERGLFFVLVSVPIYGWYGLIPDVPVRTWYGRYGYPAVTSARSRTSASMPPPAASRCRDRGPGSSAWRCPSS